MAKERILVVDDERNIVELIKYNLEKEGYEVICAYDGIEAVNVARQDRPDLIILDIMLEEADDGVILAQELRRKGCAMPILLLTAISRITRHHYGPHDELLPVNDCLEKPTQPETLIATVQRLLADTEAPSHAQPQS